MFSNLPWDLWVQNAETKGVVIFKVGKHTCIDPVLMCVLLLEWTAVHTNVQAGKQQFCKITILDT